MKRETDEADIDYEEIVISLKDCDVKIRKRLLNTLKKLGVRFENECYY